MKKNDKYRAGWKVSNGALTANICLAIALLIIGYVLYRETISIKQVVGILVCGLGLFLIIIKSLTVLRFLLNGVYKTWCLRKRRND